ncbi:transglycosylase SLT domain-containing protein [Desulfosediminicola flagellatus]|uniref:transglycosylase SLT domain-containing protein n=1 Tax=Desulfosediminicola flagellatus TaxID=2569541 RepID=UPI0010AD33E7|nr:transporter substrate-binding domain-containing protein [Desulfosediminicola flagellatus]
MNTFLLRLFSMPGLLILTIIFQALLPASSLAAIPASTSSENLLEKNTKFTGDFDAMIERRMIRVLVPYSKTYFFFDGAKPKGLSYEGIKAFENYVNSLQKKKSHLKVGVMIIPTPRASLLQNLNDGIGDIAIGNLTITDKRLKIVDFSDPFLSDVTEILITAKTDEKFKNAEDLSGHEIHVRESSSYYESLKQLNKKLKSNNKKPVKIVKADEQLEDEDLLEMINANLIPAIIMDNHKAEFWVQILKNITMHPHVEVAREGNIGWAVRKKNPKLKKVINTFTKKHKKGTLLGNVAFNKYLENTKYITDSSHGEDLKKFTAVVQYFKEYGKQYDFDYLMLTALAYQESRLDHSVRSKVGAVGIMQILPATAASPNVGIPNIEKLEPNIQAGTKYLRVIADKYFPESKGLDPLNRALFCMAAYNAGPSRIQSLQKEAEKEGYNPKIWFNNVEVIAAKRIGRETVRYVQNIFKYYIAYKLLTESLEQKPPAKT